MTHKFIFTSISITFSLMLKAFPFQEMFWFWVNYIVKLSKTVVNKWHCARYLINNFMMTSALQSVIMNKKALLNWKSASQPQIIYWLSIFLLWQDTCTFNLIVRSKFMYRKPKNLLLRKLTKSPVCEIWNYFIKK